jgi:hypothetical protein
VNPNDNNAFITNYMKVTGPVMERYFTYQMTPHKHNARLNRVERFGYILKNILHHFGMIASICGLTPDELAQVQDNVLGGPETSVAKYLRYGFDAMEESKVHDNRIA